MANGGGSRGRTGGPRRTGGAKPSTPARGRPKAPKRDQSERRQREEPRDFVLGAIPGATPGKWIGLWRERMPHVTLVLREIAVADQRASLTDLDAALVRLPMEVDDDLHVIPLYEEQAVVVMSTDSDLTAADELDRADLAGEVVIVPRDDVLGTEIPDAVAPAFAPPADTAEAIATVAAGVGVVIVPMSLARAHQRRDVEYRVLRDGPGSTVALSWLRERTTPDVEAFVGVVRGRTARSSR
ncbi:LysR substrate-binding domain-containing protein [Microbacterium sp. VKM Ac-2923]|uniref:LysR substrate-binding domain-containing protein n=1 Tax=Microbacterium sp. VKM Ac-2923 TaxID=2929476 RepID=UPI001FB2F272|nr:LysR substrate-binding domain-containing protein [Microbacterium sp. VKM Ac-2923]MCJ1706286.1 LysR substrate-binding domain-containing protein [Microbacterium sp. VKM Ac-2923]